MDDNIFNLTPREYDVMKQLCDGKNNNQIAESLGIEVSTVKFHITHIFDKLGVLDRFQAFVKWNQYYG
jgi:DNA-binding NarL/FixJ family response regulator